MFIIPLVILAVPVVAGYFKYREQKKSLEKAAKPDRTSLKHRLDRE